MRGPGGARAAAEGEEQVFRSVCRMCHGTCGTLVHVRNGRVVKVEGNPEAITNKGTLCVRGLSTIQHQYNPGGALPDEAGRQARRW
jgi:anaerobic selenocysteine-containing dehydrogenase